MLKVATCGFAKCNQIYPLATTLKNAIVAGPFTWNLWAVGRFSPEPVMNFVSAIYEESSKIFTNLAEYTKSPIPWQQEVSVRLLQFLQWATMFFQHPVIGPKGHVITSPVVPFSGHLVTLQATVGYINFDKFELNWAKVSGNQISGMACLKSNQLFQMCQPCLGRPII